MNSISICDGATTTAGSKNTVRCSNSQAPDSHACTLAEAAWAALTHTTCLHAVSQKKQGALQVSHHSNATTYPPITTLLPPRGSPPTQGRPQSAPPAAPTFTLPLGGDAYP
jgi:hypothetical protein